MTERQKQIVRVAVKLIAARGIQNFTIKNVATEIGITEPALYRHFENKLAILKAVVNSFRKLMQPAFSKLDERDNCYSKIKKFILEHFHILTNNPDFARVIFSEANFQNEEILIASITKMMKEARRSLEAVVISGQDNNEIRKDISSITIVRIIIGSMRFLITQWNLSGSVFDLENEGTKLIEDIGKIIKK